MPRPLSFAKISVDLKLGQATASEIPDPETPWRMAILGDFSGRTSRADPDRRPAPAASGPRQPG